MTRAGEGGKRVSVFILVFRMSGYGHRWNDMWDGIQMKWEEGLDRVWRREWENAKV